MINKFNSDIINDFSEFSGLSISDIKKRVDDYHDLSNKEWNNISCQEYDKKAALFYGNSQYYIYDLLAASANQNINAAVDKLNKFNPMILKSIKNHPGNRFLEFGGGLGVFCQVVLGLSKKVSYCDIPGLVSDFAIWRFKKYQLPVEVIISDPATTPKIENTYDVIFSDGVIEHVINPELAVATLCSRLDKGGLLILLVDLNDKGEYAMHRQTDIMKLHKIIRIHGLLNISGENTFCSIWKKETNATVYYFMSKVSSFKSWLRLIIPENLRKKVNTIRNRIKHIYEN